MSRKGIGVATNVFTLSKTFIQVHNDNLFAHVHPVISNEEILFVTMGFFWCASESSMNITMFFIDFINVFVRNSLLDNFAFW